MGQKPLLAPKASPISDQPAITADDPVTGNNDNHWVPVVGLPNGPGRSWPSQRRGHLSVRGCPAVGDAEKLSPDLFLEFRSLEVESQRKVLPSAPKIFVELNDGLFQ